MRDFSPVRDVVALRREQVVPTLSTTPCTSAGCAFATGGCRALPMPRAAGANGSKSAECWPTARERAMAVEHERERMIFSPRIAGRDSGAERRGPTLRPAVLIVSDARIYRDGLTTHFAASGDVEVVGVAASEMDARAEIPLLAPDVVLCDMALPGGLATARSLATVQSTTRVIVFAVPDDELAVPACAEAGVAGFVTRDASMGDLTAAVLGVARGEIVCSPRATAALYHRLASISASRDTPDSSLDLTKREREIVGLIDRGMSNKDIARVLGIGLATAKNHVHHILEKLRVERRSDVVPRLRELAREREPASERTGVHDGPRGSMNPR